MVCNIMFICPSLDLGIHVIGSILKQYKPFRTLHAKLKLILRWCVQNLSTFNDDTNYKPVSMISNLTETTMCLIEETGDSTHERTGRGIRGSGTATVPPPSPWEATQIFWAAREILAKPIFAKVSMFRLLRLFFFMKAIFFYLKLKQAW